MGLSFPIYPLPINNKSLRITSDHIFQIDPYATVPVEVLARLFEMKDYFSNMLVTNGHKF